MITYPLLRTLRAMARRLQRFKDRDTRRLFAVILTGKLLGVAGLLAGTNFPAPLPETPAGAAPLGAAARQADSFISSINTAWVLITAFLVFFMQAGFMALEAGLARSRGAVDTRLGGGGGP